MLLLDRLQAYYEAVTTSAGRTAPVVAPLLPDDLSGGAAAGRAVLLACTPAALRPPAPIPGVRFLVLAHDATLDQIRANLDVNARGFDPEAPEATPAEAEAFRAELTAGQALTAVLDGMPAAAGMVTAPAGGIAELMGITTLAAYRRRGLAAALTAELAQAAFALGVDTAILSTDNPIAYRVYLRIGFRPVAALLPAS